MWGEFIRFALSGVAALAAHLVCLVLLVEMAGLWTVAGSAIGYLAAIAVNYTLLHYWVFEARGRPREYFPRYALVAFVAFWINIVLFWLATEAMGIWYPFAQVLVIGLIFGLNFLIGRTFVFRQ